MGRAVGTVVAKDAAEDFERRLLLRGAVVDVVGRRDDEDPVLFSSPRHPDVELGTGHSLLDEDDRPVGGRSLCLVDGEGVTEGDVLFDVDSREDEAQPAVERADDGASVGAAGRDPEAVAVADEAATIAPDPPVVAQSDDLVADPDRAGRDRDARGFDLASPQAVCLAAPGELVGGLVVPRHDEDRGPFVTSGPPDGERPIEHLFSRPRRDPSVGVVSGKGRGVAGPEAKRRRLLPGVAEAPHGLELGPRVFADEGAEDPAWADGAELLGFADEDELRPRFEDGSDQLRQVVGAGHRRFVEDHDASLIERSCRVSSRLVEEEFGERL